MSLQHTAQILAEEPTSQHLLNTLNSVNVPLSGKNLSAKVDQTLKTSSKIRICKIMNHKLRLLIPSTIHIDIPWETSAYVEQANQLLSECFGGSICKKFVGFYQSSDYRLISESIFEVEVWMTEAELLHHLPKLEDFILQLLTELQQETVFLVIDDTASLIEKRKTDNFNFEAIAA
ncbi:hypothetical protein [Coleofasciculus sp. F4-SAH-05]|jgi:hypothetical protein|uniref:hypothetical protein n=1 Tax=Coleofasciculus TaxID=669368 RepID=UPI0033046D0E